MIDVATAISNVEAAADAWRQAMRALQEAALLRMQEEGAAQATVEAAADVMSGSTDAADSAMTLTFLDAVAVVGAIVEA